LKKRDARSALAKRLQHHGATTQQSTAGRHHTPLGDDGDFLPHGIEPKLRPRPRLLLLVFTEEARPPLSQSLRPARPPEEGERGAGEGEATLKAAHTRGRLGEREVSRHQF
jgi:hypothetical protein